MTPHEILKRLDSSTALDWDYSSMHKLFEGCFPGKYVPTAALQYVSPLEAYDNGIWVLQLSDEVKTFSFLETVIEYLQLPRFRN